MILVRRLRTVVPHDHRRVSAAAQELGGRGVAPLHGLGNHGRQLTGEVRRDGQRMRIIEVVHQRINRQIGHGPVNPLEAADRNRIRVHELPVQVAGLGIHIIDVEREGDHRHATIEIFRGRSLGEIVRDDGEIGGNLHTSQYRSYV